MINNNLTWQNHLYGDDNNEGLVQQLSKRIGVLKKMSRQMDRKNLKFFAAGMFYSKLIYCLPVYGNVFGLEQYREQNFRYQSYSVKDNHKLQVLQNNLNRLLLNAKYDTPTEVLLQETSSLSIQQMTAYHTVVLTKKIISTGKPSYIAQRMTKLGGVDLRNNRGKVMVQKRKLAISREGFIYRAAVLYNAINEDLRREENGERFKSGLKKWVLENISVKPRSKFPRIESRRISRNTDDVNVLDQNDI